MGSEGRRHLARQRVRVPSQAPVPARRAVHQRDRARRSRDGRHRAASQMTHLRQGYGGQVLLARWRVTLGFVFAAIVLWLATPTPQSLVIGAIIAAIGESIRIWAAGHLEKSKEVT